MDLRRPHPIWGCPDDIAMMGALRTCSIHQYAFSHTKNDTLRNCPQTWYNDEKEPSHMLVPSPRQNQVRNKNEVRKVQSLKNVYSVAPGSNSCQQSIRPPQHMGSLPRKQASSTFNPDMRKTDRQVMLKKKAEPPKYQKLGKNPIAPWNQMHNELRASLDHDMFKPKSTSQLYKHALPKMVLPPARSGSNVRSFQPQGDVVKLPSQIKSITEIKKGYATVQSHDNEDAHLSLLYRADTSSSTCTGSSEMGFLGLMTENVEEESENENLCVNPRFREDTPDSVCEEPTCTDFLLDVGNNNDDDDEVLNNLLEYADSEGSAGIQHSTRDGDMSNGLDNTSESSAAQVLVGDS